MEFCKAFNAATQKLEPGLPIPTIITAYSDRSFTFITKTPPATDPAEEGGRHRIGFGKRPNTEKVGKVTRKQLEEIAKAKMPDLTAADLDAAVRTIAGSARSMGLVGGGLDMKDQQALQGHAQARSRRARPTRIDEALKIVKDNAKTKFVESVDVAIRLGIDAKKSDQGVRGSTMLPHGTGKTVRVAVFCPPGEKAEAAKAAGADAVGMEDLAEKMQAGDSNFGRVIATPDAMRVVGKLGQLLGPRGLMPNPKDGSVAADVVTAVKNAKAGQVKFRNDKAGIVHCTIGKANFEVDALKENLQCAARRPDEGEAGDARRAFSCRRCRCRARWVSA